MTLRCGKCGARFAAPPSRGAGAEVRCPACGTTLRPPADSRSPPDLPRRSPWMPSPEQMPRVVGVIVGVLVIVALLAPFWLDWFAPAGRNLPRLLPSGGRLPAGSRAPLLGSGVEPGPAPRTTGGVVNCNQYRDLRLDMPRELVEQRYRLQPHPLGGAAPAIYEAAGQQGSKLVVAQFYENRLKEFYVAATERPTVPAVLATELRALYGEPVDPAAEDAPIGNGPRTTAWGRLSLTDYHWQRSLAWSDGDSQLEATIFSTAKDSPACVSLLVVHVSAVRWLDQHRSRAPMAAMPAAATPPVPAVPELDEGAAPKKPLLELAPRSGNQGE